MRDSNGRHFFKGDFGFDRPQEFRPSFFRPYFLYDFRPPQNMALIIHQGRDYLPGDCVYLKNPDHDLATPEWQGENAILLGNNLFYGHGIGITTAQGIIDELNSNRKAIRHHISISDNAYHFPGWFLL